MCRRHGTCATRTRSPRDKTGPDGPDIQTSANPSFEESFSRVKARCPSWFSNEGCTSLYHFHHNAINFFSFFMDQALLLYGRPDLTQLLTSSGLDFAERLTGDICKQVNKREKKCEVLCNSCKGNPRGNPFPILSYGIRSPFRSFPSSFRPDSIRVCRTLYAFLLFVRGSIVRVIPLPGLGSIWHSDV